MNRMNLTRLTWSLFVTAWAATAGCYRLERPSLDHAEGPTTLQGDIQAIEAIAQRLPRHFQEQTDRDKALGELRAQIRTLDRLGDLQKGAPAAKVLLCEEHAVVDEVVLSAVEGLAGSMSCSEANLGVLAALSGSLRAGADGPTGQRLEAAVWHMRGRLSGSRGELMQARDELRRAVELAPNSAAAANSYAWLCATAVPSAVRDGASAIRWAQTACQQREQWQYVDTLAAAHAEAGDFAKAKELQQQAIAAAQAAQADEWVATLEFRRTLYQRQLPYRELEIADESDLARAVQLSSPGDLRSFQKQLLMGLGLVLESEEETPIASWVKHWASAAALSETELTEMAHSYWTHALEDTSDPLTATWLMLQLKWTGVSAVEFVFALRESKEIDRGLPSINRVLAFCQYRRAQNAERSVKSRLAEGAKPRLGVMIGVTRRSRLLSGVEVLDVSADTPAQRLLGATDGRAYTLVPNRDIITQVNGVPVDTAEACQAEIARSPDRMALRVYDTATDSFSDYAVDLGTTSLVAQSGDAP